MDGRQYLSVDERRARNWSVQSHEEVKVAACQEWLAWSAAQS
jgi:hypothetical protein